MESMLAMAPPYVIPGPESTGCIPQCQEEAPGVLPPQFPMRPWAATEDENPSLGALASSRPCPGVAEPRRGSAGPSEFVPSWGSAGPRQRPPPPPPFFPGGGGGG